jgi:hypothetical protein
MKIALNVKDFLIIIYVAFVRILREGMLILNLWNESPYVQDPWTRLKINKKIKQK